MTEYNNYVFMDNFRGFENSVLPLTEMNFFVGENSTGKSSVLSLVKIITNLNFWFNNYDFKADEVNLGHAGDIISIASEDKSYFRVGYLNAGNEEKSLISNGFLITYYNKSGVAVPSMISIIRDNNQIIHIKITKTTASYKLENAVNLKIGNLSEATALFSKLNNFHRSGKGYIKLKQLDQVKTRDVTLRLAVFLTFDEINLGNVEGADLSDRIPNTKRPCWLAPIRSKPRRTYDEPIDEFTPEGDHTPYVLSNMSSSSHGANVKGEIESVAQYSGLFKKLEIKKFGRTKNAPFELDVILDEMPLSIMNVGYGVSQSLPILTEVIIRSKNSWLIIQQPEVHLHPRAQAELGTLFNYAMVHMNHTFLIETHSDFMIDRFRLDKNKSSKNKNDKNESDSQIIFFQRENGKNKFSTIPIYNNGQISSDQPQAYREFFLNEELNLLGV